MYSLLLARGARLKIIFRVYFSRAEQFRIEVAEKFPILPLRNSEKFPILCIENT